jgi:hypothetical protein
MGGLLEFARLYFRYLLRVNAYIFDDDSIDVCVTSHGGRIISLPAAIESILTGNKRPRRVILTIDEEEVISALKRLTLNKLRRNGVTIIRGARLGPHSKYYHYLEQLWQNGNAFVVVDDDMIYRRDLLSLLVDAARSNPSANICTRSFTILTTEVGIAKYSLWPKNTHVGFSRKIFATNVGGVLISGEMAHLLKTSGKIFQETCPRADDIWFFVVALRQSIPYFQCIPSFYSPIPIPFTQRSALHLTNMPFGNDEQLRASISLLHLKALMDRSEVN